MSLCLPKPNKTRCSRCGQTGPPGQTLRRCSKCRTMPYCSVECQRADWKSHKQVCTVFATEKNSNYAGVYVGEKAPKFKKGVVRRTRGDILQDLTAFANSHNRDTLTISAWNLLGLDQDISRAQSHFLALTLVRTDSSNPRTMYTLGEAAALPFSELEVLYTNRANFADSSRMSPKMVLAQDAADRKRSGGLGSVMVVSVELPNGDTKSPRDALKELVVHLLQPLGLFNVHKNSLSRLPSLPREFYIKCLENSLRGGA